MIARRKGFTLIEMLLVMVIISIIIYASVGYVQQRALQMRIDRTSTQMQQIMNAALAYYVYNSSWPGVGGTPITTLQSQNFLPPNIVSPWVGQPYSAAIDAQGKQFYVWAKITTVSTSGAYAAANVIAGTLPLAYTSTDAGTPPTVPPSTGSPCVATSTTCYVVSSVNIPGQNLNNASAVNFAGLYRHGGCVPVPTCPVDANGNTMQSQVMITPVSVSGLNDSGNSNVYPISSFTAYATGGTNTSPPQCAGQTVIPPCTSGIQGNPANAYWRACLQVVTEKGNVQTTNTSTSNSATDYGGNVTLMALTRCSKNNEPAGSQFTIYGN